jgi:hypothetical protein
MRYCRTRTDLRNRRQLAVALLLLWGCLPGRANVYATDIKLNGSTNNAAIAPAEMAAAVQISYILNEPATNVLLQIYSGTNMVWAGALAGTNAGSNSVVWGGTNLAGETVAAGAYQVSITAASAGYADWTGILDENANFQLIDPSGIAVNKNTNSPYYGRVFVGDATSDHNAGIYKFNADGSFADEGGFSTGGYPWAGALVSPWKIAVAQDDTVYINDWSGDGVVLAFDEMISTNYLTVLDANNYMFPNEQLSGPCVTGGGAGTQIWMADDSTGGNSAGVVRYDVAADGAVAPGDTGTQVVGISSTGLSTNAYDVSVDAIGNIYVIQSLDGVDNPDVAWMPRVFCFPPYSGQADLSTNWSIDSLDNALENAQGIAVNPAGLLVAVAVLGYGGDVFTLQNGAVNIYNATNATLANRLTPGHEFLGVAWDNVGNLYATDFSALVWRAYSPPGANQATTVAVPVIQVYDTLARPHLRAPAAPVAAAGTFEFTLRGQSNVTYVIESSPDLINWTPIATNYDTVKVRTVTVPVQGGASFFQAVVPCPAVPQQND